GIPCSYSPSEAAWNQMVLSEAEIFEESVAKTDLRPSTNSFIFGLNNATICNRKPAIRTTKL
ncbi:MAG TPA: hypothetical protein VLB74_08975, partial [Flavobacterium sp.]|nr:hypothetical protein [Flavobacterium sp.]